MTTRPIPAPVRGSVALWLAAIGLGATEALVHIALPDPPTPVQLAVRFAIYAALAALVLALWTGRAALRWAVAALLGGLGTLSLVIEPAEWILAGAAPLIYLAAADGPTLLVVALRSAHLAAVLAALVLMFRPESNAFFRSPTTARAGLPSLSTVRDLAVIALRRRERRRDRV